MKTPEQENGETVPYKLVPEKYVRDEKRRDEEKLIRAYNEYPAQWLDPFRNTKEKIRAEQKRRNI